MDNFDEITDIEQLEAAITEATDAVAPLLERMRNGETLDAAERAQVTEAADRRDAAQARLTAVQAEAEAEAAAQAELLTRFQEPEAPAVETPAEEAPAAEATPAEPVEAEPVAEEAPMPEAIAAAGARPAPARRPVPHPDPVEETAPVGAQVAIVASASLAQIGHGATIDLDQVGEMLGAQARSFPKPTGRGDGSHDRDLRYHPIAQFQITHDDAHTLTGDVESDEIKIAAALDPKNVRNRQGQQVGLTAAGGWCAPSEVLYGIPVVGESLAGIASIPEMDASRGGIKTTLGPDYSTIYPLIGFEQTETQAINGDTKDCYEIDCPSFTETRMDVKGVCLMVPILTQAGYPEYVDRITSGALVVHAHKMNAYKLAKIEAGSVGKTATQIGSTAEDTLFALELRAEYTRQKFAMEFDETLEVILPHWVRVYMRSDLALRMGLDPRNPITDQALDAHFTARHLNVQWVYDWAQLTSDPISGTPPTTFKALIYPAGTWLALTKSVISLSAVYDAASLATNTYTGTFTEEGVGVRKMTNAPSEVVTLPICSRGRVGAANLTCS